MKKNLLILLFSITVLSCNNTNDSKIHSIEMQILDSMLKKADTVKVEQSYEFDTVAIIADTAAYFSDLYKSFKPTNRKKFEIDENKLDFDSFRRLKPIDLRLLLKNSTKFYSQYGKEYESWYAFQKSVSKNYFSLYFVLNIEGSELIQTNFNKKDSSLISIKRLAGYYGACDEYGYSYSFLKNDTLKYFDIAYYQECSKECIEYYDSTISIYILSQNGIYDSIQSKNYKLKVKF